MTNTPMTFDEWFDSEKFDFEAGTERYHKMNLAWQASQAQQASVIAELVEALELTSAICAGETLSKSTLINALEKAQAILAKVKGK